MSHHPLDTYNFRQMILDSPGQFMVGLKIAQEARPTGSFSQVMISGMGGSALPGNLFRVFLGDLARRGKLSGKQLAIYQNRFYDLPHESFENCLNLFCSYSGNTEETVSAFEEALRAKLPSVAFSNGGKLETLAEENGVPHVKLPMPTEGFQPRMGTGYFIGAMYQVLLNAELVPDASQEIRAGAEWLSGKLGEYEERGKALAEKIKGKTPVIYASTRFKSVAMIWKIKVNENAKTPAFWNFFPELNHNEMVGWTKPQGAFAIIMLLDPEDHPQNRKRFGVTKDLVSEKGVGIEIIEMEGRNAFEKMFGSILLADFTSYYLALSYGENPTPVAMVEDFKKML